MRKNRRLLTEEKKQYDSKRVDYLLNYNPKKDGSFIRTVKDTVIISEDDIVKKSLKLASSIIDDDINKLMENFK